MQIDAYKFRDPSLIYADQRWIGDHGIGRFARQVLTGLDYRPVPLSSNPAAPSDTWRLSRALSPLTSKDVFFSPGYNTPLFCGAPFVFTIHDLSHVYCAENSSPLIRLYYSTVMKRACFQAKRILTVSDFTRSQIVQWSGVSPGKVINVGCGVDPSYRPEGDGFDLPFPYLLCVSNRKPHKNEFRIANSFAKARIDPGIRLVFTGPPTAPLTEFISKNGVDSKVQFLGRVPENRLPALYRGAMALIFPSLYEGFGLPLVEAMASGTPVVTSNVTALPEIAGDAALLVDPTSVKEITIGIQRIVSDPVLRQEFRERGLEQAAKFSWDRTTRQVHDLLMGISSSGV